MSSSEATGTTGEAAPQSPIEVSVILPCLDEEAAIEQVVRAAWAGLAAADVTGEVLVVDNGCADRSAELARAAGASVIDEPRRGYGSACLAGLTAARGRYALIADADGTYPLDAIPLFVEKLRDGAEFVIGSRFNGTIHRGAMPWANRYLGNPILTTIVNLLFVGGVSDVHCGLRACRREVLPALNLSATGMELATEMVIKAGKRGLKVEEIPIDYHPRIGESKLARVGDAWRHVRLMLVHSPTFLFSIPGGLTTLTGLVGLMVLACLPGLPEPWTGVSVAFAMLAVVGVGLLQLGVLARTYAVVYLGETDVLLERGWRHIRLEHGLAASTIVGLIGFVITATSFFDRVEDPRLGILGLCLMTISSQGVFAAFFLSILGLSEHAILPPRKRGA